MKQSPKFEIYIDGSSRGNPGPAGYGIVIFNEAGSIEYARSAQYTNATNNRMELSALVGALDWLNRYYPGTSAIIYCDSAYTVNAFNDWIPNIWSRNGWVNSQKRTVENVDIMKMLYEFKTEPFFDLRIMVKHCKGHDDIEGNELADRLATGNIGAFYQILAGMGNIAVKELDECNGDELPLMT